MIRRSLRYSALLLGLLLPMSGTSRADPVQGVVLGAGVGAVVGGGKGAAVGAVLGGAGGAAAQSKEKEEQERWKAYYQEQEKAQELKESGNPSVGTATPPPAPVGKTVETQPPLPTGSGLIKEIQRSLTVLGYYTGPVDGLTAGDTMDAIRSYQEDNGLLTTGRASIDLLQHMRQKGE